MNNEVKSVGDVETVNKRIEFLEELITTQRREIFNTITNVEQGFSRKQEKIVKAVHQLARNQDIPEALLMV